jgi:L-ascorbate metabolism protein UlaG (beta-lactamase superfamily)
MVEKIHWLGHDAFRVDTDRVIYFDPWKLKKGQPTADLILISHEHYDHCSPEDVALIRGPKTVVVAPAPCAQKLGGAVRVVQVGDTLEVEGVQIEVVPAYNVDKKFHPRSPHNVGYIVTVGGTRIYHAGDTDYIPEMAGFRADIALLPVSGTYVMTADEAVKAAEAIKPAVVIPMHYGTIVGSERDAQRFQQACPVPVRILQPE